MIFLQEEHNIIGNIEDEISPIWEKNQEYPVMKQGLIIKLRVAESQDIDTNYCH